MKMPIKLFFFGNEGAFFSTDDGTVSAVQAAGNRQLI
jgi:hypothetical protein